MTKKSFTGDSSYRLPKGKREPYRLWFEYLKLATRYPSIKVDAEIYKSWGKHQDTDFDKWWDTHWRELFATRATTRIVSSVADFEEAVSNPDVVVLQVSMLGTKASRAKDIEAALATVPRKSGRKIFSDGSPRFAISAPKIDYRTLRGMLKYLEFFQKSHCNLDKASVAYLRWASAWNAKIRAKKLKLPTLYVPPYLPSLVREIEIFEDERMRKGKAKRSKEYTDRRNQARKFIVKGERVLSNVAKGIFPGKF